ncbi:MAG: hypothetical protein WCC64_11175 [Aliidongia sp.]
MAHTNQIETSVEREARLAHERALLAEADADLAAGRYLTGEALEDWLDAFVGDGDTPSAEVSRARQRALEVLQRAGAGKPPIKGDELSKEQA